MVSHNGRDKGHPRLDESGTRPTALLVTSGQSTTIARGLREVKERCRITAPGVKVCVKAVPTAQIPAQLRADVDVLIFDGHGYLPAEAGDPPWIGWVPIRPDFIRDSQRRGITATMVVFGACRAGRPEFIAALETCIDSPAAFMGCLRETRYQQAAIFDDVIKVLEDLGPGSEPEAFRVRLAAKLDEADAAATGWRVQPLTPVVPPTVGPIPESRCRRLAFNTTVRLRSDDLEIPTNAP
jgi:hypothetical protein